MSNDKYANTAEVSELEAASLDGPTGREDHLGATEASGLVAGEINKPIGAHPKSDETNIHDAGSGANETIDGLDSLAEAVRHGAEQPVDLDEREDVPVFDRGRE